MSINVDEDNLKNGLLGVVVALVEIIEEALERQALRRIDSGRLSEEEIERLAEALIDLNEALENIKKENDLQDAVNSVRKGLDQLADRVIDESLSQSCMGEET